MGSDSPSKNNYGPEKYKEILFQNGIRDPVDNVRIQSFDLDGNGFLSSCEVVTVKFKDKLRSPLSLFVKKQVQNEEYAQQLNDCRIYEREQKFFSVLLPDLLHFANGKPTYSGFLETAVPKCFLADGNLLVMENLKAKGFVILDRLIPHGLDEAKLSLDAIAKVHAATYVLIKTIGLDEFQSKYAFVHEKNTWSEAGKGFMGPWCQMPVDGAIKILKAKPIAASERALEFFLQYESDAFLKMIPQYDITVPSCGIVLNHGDYWNSNIMFKLNPETKTPEQCVAIDWQTSHLGSPVLDLLFYLFFVVNGAVRRKEWLYFLRFYYEKFNEYAAQLGQDRIFTYQELEDDFRKKSSIGCILAMYSIFGLEALRQVGDIANEEGSFENNLTSTMSIGIDRLMDEKGEKFSNEILETFEEFQRIRLL